MIKRGLNRPQKKSAQIWVETVIYTLIGLTIIGLLLAVSKPVIEKQQDRALIEQAINSIGKVDEKVNEVLSGSGNKRNIELKIGKGQVTIDGESNKVIWELDSNFEYSQEGLPISAGNIEVTTLPGSPWKVRLEKIYSYDIKFDNKDMIKTFSQSPTPHTISIENLGNPNGKTVINFNEV